MGSTTIANDYEVESYLPEHKSQVAALQSQLWGSDLENNRDYFEWKYEQNPLVDKVLVLVALHQGKVVAFRGFFPQRWKTEDGSVLNVLSASDMVVDERHRRRGLFKLLTEAAFTLYEETDFYLNLSSNQQSTPGYLKFGWRLLMEKYCPYSCSLRGNCFRALRRISRHGAIQRNSSLSSGIKKAMDSLCVVSENPFEGVPRMFDHAGYQVVDSTEYRFDDIGKLTESLSAGKIAHVHSREYMEWRFKSPRHRYRFIYLYKNEMLCGYAIVWQWVGEVQNEGTVIDYGAIGENELKSMIVLVKKSCKFNMLSWVVYGRRADLNVFSKKGFNTKQQIPDVLVRPSRMAYDSGDWQYAGDSLLNADRWYVRGIYSDGV